ncbi:MAG: response regulator [Actinobacteria bacterium]|nr:response regulator [Actinomycetota bacterium]MBU1943459.1 response regulator [Actinomycetota bacterium]MBU2686816.1 response regulator [Actinomycetota bacterium]
MKKPGATALPATRKRVLVADDDHMLVEALCLFLGLEGFEVISAQSGMGALNEIEMSSPDAVILDISMPVLDGAQVCRHLRNVMGDRNTPVIVLTGLVDQRWRKLMSEAGADEFVPKPCDFKELSSLVSRLTGDGVEAEVSETGRD